MTERFEPLNRKEMFSASMVVFLGLYYVIIFVLSLLQAKSLQISTQLLMVELKWFLSGLLFVSGGVLMFLKKQAGWVISTATLLNFVLIIFMNILSLSQIGKLNAYIAIVIGFFGLLCMAFLFLFRRPTRLKFRVNNKSYLLTIALYLMLITVTFWL